MTDDWAKLLAESKEKVRQQEEEEWARRRRIIGARSLIIGIGLFCGYCLLDLLAEPTRVPSHPVAGFFASIAGIVMLVVSWSYFRDKDTARIYRLAVHGLKETWNGELGHPEEKTPPGQVRPSVFAAIGFGGSIFVVLGLGTIWLPLEVVGLLAVLVWVGVWFARLPEEEKEQPDALAEAPAPEPVPSPPPEAPVAAEDPIQAALDKVYARLKK